MEVPLELHFDHLEPNASIKELIDRQVAKLDRHCKNIIACRVTVERPNRHVDQGSGFRVRIDVTVPPRHELVVSKENWQGDANDELTTVINEAFRVMCRRLDKLRDEQQGNTKQHPEQEVQGIVEQVLDGFGFIRTTDNRTVYFHANSVVDGFERIDRGTGVAFAEVMGDEGPQASSVRIVEQAA